jgi:hypothetical protein
MTSEQRYYGKAASWILLSPLLFLMAAISTVESLTTNYVQLVIFGLATLLGMATGIGYLFGWSWAAVTAKYLFWAIAFCFLGIPLLIAAFILWQTIVSSL